MTRRARFLGMAVLGLLALAWWAGPPLDWLGKLATAAYSSRFPPGDERLLREVEGEDLEIAVFGPPPGANLRPAILFFHGGGWSTGHRAMFYPYADHFAELGWVTLSASYRTFGSHGTPVRVALDDTRHALRWLVQNAPSLGVDPARIVLSGGSAGGHLAAATTLIEPEFPVAAMVLFNPAIDTSMEPMPPRWGTIARLFEGKGRAVSPLHHVGRDAPPTLVFHGSDDGMVPVEHSEDFCLQMKASGNTCELRVYEGASHGFFNYGFGHFSSVAGRAERFLGSLGLTPGGG